MEKRIFWVVPAVVLCFAIFTSSCQNNDPNTAASDAITATASDEAQVSATNDEVVNATDQYVPSFGTAAKVMSSISQLIPDSVIVTVDKPDSISFPKVVTIDYGTTGVTGKRGNILKGKIIVTISNKMSIIGSTKTIKFVDFSVNGNTLTGSKTITFNGNASWSISAKDTINRTDGTVITWSTERTRTRIDDNQTPLIKWDDTYAITGSSSGVNAKGKAYTMTIDANNPLIIGGLCPYFTKGSMIITSEAKTILLDFGDGTKDALATVTVDGKTKTITLKK
jgi:hypothetical protein